ncbi:MAG: glutaminase, partial [Myxococcales bacterium]|nr:glutaminase [Myxococcales bacterium]
MTDRVRKAVARAHECARKLIGDGKVASYIPELAKADPNQLAITAHCVDGDVVQVGDNDVPFTLQSASKIFSLALVLGQEEPSWLEDISIEPSGDAFHSIVRLEEEAGRPRNPLINAGAISVTARVPGATAEAKSKTFVEYLQRLEPDTQFGIDEDIYRSEARTGAR